MKTLVIFIAMEILVFFLAAGFFFAIGVLNDGLQGGFRMASAVLYSWFAFAILGLVAWLICMIALRFKKD